MSTMIEFGREEKLRRQERLVGHKILLNNGDEWTVPSMPLGKSSLWFADKIEEVDAIENSDMKNSLQLYIELVHRILEINYPTLTAANCDGLVGIAEFRKILLSFQGIDPDEEKAFLDLSDLVEESTPQEKAPKKGKRERKVATKT